MSLAGIKRRGFASLSPERKKEIASLGGRTAQGLGKSHKFSKELAKIAGRKGGLAKKTRELLVDSDPI